MRLADVGQHPEGRRCRTGEHEESGEPDQHEAGSSRERHVGRVVDAEERGDHHQATDDPNRHDRRAAEAPNEDSRREDAGQEDDERDAHPEADLAWIEPTHQQLIVERRVLVLAHELEEGLRRPRADDRVERDPRRCEQPDAARPEEVPVMGEAECGRPQPPTS